MDWRQSYSASWRVYKVNRDTWADADPVGGIDSVGITRTADGNLLESGSIEVSGEISTDYYRVVMLATQGDDVERVDVATLLFDVTGGKVDFGHTVQTVEGHSVLYPASVTTMLAGEYAPAGVDGAAYVKEILEEAINAPVMVEGSFVLNDHVVHEIGSSILESAWAVLDAGGFVIQIDGRGVVHIKPKPEEPVLIIDRTNTRLLTNEINYTTDESDVPNRYVVIEDVNRTVAENADEDSAISTVNRGYCVDMVDESPTPINGETLSAYANRRLKEVSVMQDERTYQREFAPGVYLYDIVKASIRGLEGDLRVESQSITCENGITVSEKATKEVPLW